MSYLIEYMSEEILGCVSHFVQGEILQQLSNDLLVTPVMQDTSNNDRIFSQVSDTLSDEEIYVAKIVANENIITDIIRFSRNYIIGSFVYCIMNRIGGRSINPEINKDGKMIFHDNELSFEIWDNYDILETINSIAPLKRYNQQHRLNALKRWFENVPLCKNLHLSSVYICKNIYRQKLMTIMYEINNMIYI